MIQILMIVDDFTDALDTGVQLAATGAKTRIITSLSSDMGKDGQETEVLAVERRLSTCPRRRHLALCGTSSGRRMELGIPHISIERPIPRCGTISGPSWRL